MHSKDRGSIIELKIASDLAEKGYKILIPFDENNRYDLVAEKDGKFVRIQCKLPAAYSNNDKIVLHCRVVNHTKSHKYKEIDFDFMATFNNGICYYVPSKLTADRNSVSLMLKENKKKNQFKVLKATDFLVL
jgi:hypothetical protein